MSAVEQVYNEREKDLGSTTIKRDQLRNTYEDIRYPTAPKGHWIVESKGE